MSTGFSPTLGSDRYLNDVNSSYIGSYDGIQEYKGMLGREIWLSDSEALALTNLSQTDYLSTTPLLGGCYKLVKMKSTKTITPARGLACYWDPTASTDAFQVTSDAPTGKTQFAGVFINAVSVSKYAWILVEGLAYIKGKASALTATGAVGDLLSIVTAAGTFDNQATAPMAITQTSAALTDNSGGSASATIAAQTGSYVQATQQNTVASLAAQINYHTTEIGKILAALQALVVGGAGHVIAYEAPAAGTLTRAYIRRGISPVRPGLQ